MAGLLWTCLGLFVLGTALQWWGLSMVARAEALTDSEDPRSADA